MLYINKNGGSLCLHLVEHDDMSDVADAVGPDGYVISGVTSGRVGGASAVLAQAVATYGHRPLGLVAHAYSGDHAGFGACTSVLGSSRTPTAILSWFVNPISIEIIFRSPT